MSARAPRLLALAAALAGGCASTPGDLTALSDRDLCVYYGRATQRGDLDGRSLAYAELQQRGLAASVGEADDEYLIPYGKLRLGMSLCAMYASFGAPAREHRSVSASGERIQHVYGARSGAYVYTERGRVVGWQD